MGAKTSAREKWLARLSDEDYAAAVECERDDRFLDLVAVLQIGADAIHEKRQVQAELRQAHKRIAQLEALLKAGDEARASILGDMVVGFTSGVIRVDKSVPIPDRFREKAK